MKCKYYQKIVYHNIVKLHGFFLHKRWMFFLYKFMERRSLYCVLSSEVESLELDWIKRVNIVKSIIHSLCYIHHDSTPPIIHRDISSNNILLISKLDVFRLDFGIARLLHPDSSNQTLLVGTYVYIAPGKYTSFLFLQLLLFQQSFELLIVFILISYVSSRLYFDMIFNICMCTSHYFIRKNVLVKQMDL